MTPGAAHAITAGLLLTLALPAAAATPEDALEKRWYEIEFFVFERPEVLDFANDEVLTLHHPRSLPARMTAMRPGNEGYEAYYSVDALTRPCLTYPTMTPLAPDEAALAATPEARTQTQTAPTEAPLGVLSETESPGLLDEPAPPATDLIVPVEPDPRAEVLAMLAEFEAGLEASSMAWFAPERLLLINEARRVEQSGLGRILFHGRWQQAVPERSAPLPVLIQAGASLEPLVASRELAGTVSVTLGRYLHFDADLYFHAPALGAAPVTMLFDAAGESHARNGTPEGGYMRLAQSRRMSSGELHYLDHPKLGVVARIDPVAVPVDLVEAFERLEESR